MSILDRLKAFLLALPLLASSCSLPFTGSDSTYNRVAFRSVLNYPIFPGSESEEILFETRDELQSFIQRYALQDDFSEEELRIDFNSENGVLLLLERQPYLYRFEITEVVRINGRLHIRSKLEIPPPNVSTPAIEGHPGHIIAVPKAHAEYVFEEPEVVYL